MRPIPSVFALAAAWLAACSPARRPRAQVVLTHDDPAVGTYVSSGQGFTTSSYWIEGPDGLVLVDTQFLTSAAGELVDWAERTTGKRAVLAIVLHANPDKFNGTTVLQARGIRVVTSRQVRDLIPGVDAIRRRWFYERFRPDYPPETPAPDVFGDRTTTLSAAGLDDLKLHVLGPGCSRAHVVLEWRGHVFVGDLLANGAHAWMELGLLDEWLERLTEIEALHPREVHPGRGPSGPPRLLVRQRAYLERVRAIVRDMHPTMPMPPDALARMTAAVEGAYPGYGFAGFLRLGLPAVWANVARALPATAPAR